MSQILVRDLDPQTVERLKVMAARNQRSLQAELKTILSDLAEQDRKHDDFVRLAREIRKRSGPQITRGTDLIRRDRDSR